MAASIPVYWENGIGICVDYVKKNAVVVRTFDPSKGWQNVYYENKAKNFPKYNGNTKDFYKRVLEYIRKELIW